MALEIVWTDEAKEGLDEIIEHLETRWTYKELKTFFVRLEECLENIKKTPQRAKNSHRKSGAKEYQHSSQTTIFYTYNDQVINILRVWANIKDPEDL